MKLVHLLLLASASSYSSSKKMSKKEFHAWSSTLWKGEGHSKKAPSQNKQKLKFKGKIDRDFYDELWNHELSKKDRNRRRSSSKKKKETKAKDETKPRAPSIGKKKANKAVSEKEDSQSRSKARKRTVSETDSSQEKKKEVQGYKSKAKSHEKTSAKAQTKASPGLKRPSSTKNRRTKPNLPRGEPSSSEHESNENGKPEETHPVRSHVIDKMLSWIKANGYEGPAGNLKESVLDSLTVEDLRKIPPHELIEFFERGESSMEDEATSSLKSSLPAEKQSEVQTLPGTDSSSEKPLPKPKEEPESRKRNPEPASPEPPSDQGSTKDVSVDQTKAGSEVTEQTTVLLPSPPASTLSSLEEPTVEQIGGAQPLANSSQPDSVPQASLADHQPQEEAAQWGYLRLNLYKHSSGLIAALLLASGYFITTRLKGQARNPYDEQLQGNGAREQGGRKYKHNQVQEQSQPQQPQPQQHLKALDDKPRVHRDQGVQAQAGVVERGVGSDIIVQQDYSAQINEHVLDFSVILPNLSIDQQSATSIINSIGNDKDEAFHQDGASDQDANQKPPMPIPNSPQSDQEEGNNLTPEQPDPRDGDNQDRPTPDEKIIQEEFGEAKKASQQDDLNSTEEYEDNNRGPMKTSVASQQPQDEDLELKFIPEDPADGGEHPNQKAPHQGEDCITESSKEISFEENSRSKNGSSIIHSSSDTSNDPRSQSSLTFYEDSSLVGSSLANDSLAGFSSSSKPVSDSKLPEYRAAQQNERQGKTQTQFVGNWPVLTEQGSIAEKERFNKISCKHQNPLDTEVQTRSTEMNSNSVRKEDED